MIGKIILNRKEDGIIRLQLDFFARENALTEVVNPIHAISKLATPQEKTNDADFLELGGFVVREATATYVHKYDKDGVPIAGSIELKLVPTLA